MANIVELSDEFISQILVKHELTPAPTPVIPIEGQINKSFTEANRLGNLYDNGPLSLGARGGHYMAFTSPVPDSLRNFDVFAIAHWLRNIARETGILPIQNNNGPVPVVERTPEAISKGVTFLASQVLLTSLNPGGIQIPGTADRQLITNINPLNAVYNPLSLPTAAIPLLRGNNLTSVTVGGLISNYQLDIQTRLATRTDAMGLLESKALLEDGILEAPASYPLSDAPSNADALDVSLSLTEIDGVTNFPIDDSVIYMPFCFQDLRNKVDEFLYFRAFIKPGYTETFTPDWQLDRYYGRVEQVPTYMGTSRVIDLSFDVVAFGPSDLKVVYKKLQKLQSMVYPFYDTKGFLQSGPIIRMRVGDLFAANGGKGLPGYLTSLNFSFEDGIWNIKNNQRVPRYITVSLSFTVLHEGNPGTYPFTNQLIGSEGNENPIGGKTFGAGQFTTNAVGDTAIDVSAADIRKIFGERE